MGANASPPPAFWIVHFQLYNTFLPLLSIPSYAHVCWYWETYTLSIIIYNHNHAHLELIMWSASCKFLDQCSWKLLVLISNRLWAQSSDLTVVYALSYRCCCWRSRRIQDCSCGSVEQLRGRSTARWPWSRTASGGLWVEQKLPQAKFSLKDKALATIVLAIDPSLLYLIGADPKDPAVVWKAFADQFQTKHLMGK